MGTGTHPRQPQGAARAGWTIGDLDLIEANERSRAGVAVNKTSLGRGESECERRRCRAWPSDRGLGRAVLTTLLFEMRAATRRKASRRCA